MKRSKVGLYAVCAVLCGGIALHAAPPEFRALTGTMPGNPGHGSPGRPVPPPPGYDELPGRAP